MSRSHGLVAPGLSPSFKDACRPLSLAPSLLHPSEIFVEALSMQMGDRLSCPSSIVLEERNIPSGFFARFEPQPCHPLAFCETELSASFWVTFP